MGSKIAGSTIIRDWIDWATVSTGDWTARVTASTGGWIGKPIAQSNRAAPSWQIVSTEEAIASIDVWTAEGIASVSGLIAGLIVELIVVCPAPPRAPTPRGLGTREHR